MVGKIIVVTSGKGGVGKTTVTANIGAALTFLGKRVILIDTDTGLRNLDITFGIEDVAIYDVINLSDGECDFEKAAIEHELYKGLYVLPASQTKTKENLSKENFKALCDNLKKRFDYVLIDCPAGIEYGFECALYPSDEAIIVTNPDRAALRDADKVAAIIEKDFPNIKTTHLIINRLIPELAKKGFVPGAEEALITVAIKLLGLIPEDPHVLINAYESRLTVTDRRSLAGKAYKNIARRLEGEDVKLINFSKKRLFKKKY